jgi:pantoate--beta-alanine ligase
MGNLHSGHLSLVNQGKLKSEVLVTSIFVNKTQFGPNEDFEKYPRTLYNDLDLLEKGGYGDNIVFVPEHKEVYPSNEITYVNVEGIHDSLESKSRPTFFRGVATVCCKLFNMVQPNKVFFGQKDAIQCIVIKRMIRDLNFDIEMNICDTVRESDGLAKSSRNSYLSKEDRMISPILYESLLEMKRNYLENNILSSVELIKIGTKVLQKQESKLKIEYISISDLNNGLEINEVRKNETIISLAVKIGNTRLIDNIII